MGLFVMNSEQNGSRRQRRPVNSIFLLFWLRTTAIAVVSLLVAGIVNVSLSAASIAGVHPSQRAAYNVSQPQFLCLNGSTSLPWEKVNDDYCDCPDGSDEPGTPACSHLPSVTFTCQNSLLSPETIPSSRVQDGVCDCCDGSDEGNGNCPDRCHSLAVETLRQLEQSAESMRKGLAEQERRMKARKRDRKSKADKIVVLREEMAKLEELKRELEKYLDMEEEKELSKLISEARRRMRAEGAALYELPGEDFEKSCASRVMALFACVLALLCLLMMGIGTGGLGKIPDKRPDTIHAGDVSDGKVVTKQVSDYEFALLSEVERTDDTPMKLDYYMIMMRRGRLYGTYTQQLKKRREELFDALFAGLPRALYLPLAVEFFGLLLAPVRVSIEALLIIINAFRRAHPSIDEAVAQTAGALWKALDIPLSRLRYHWFFRPIYFDIRWTFHSIWNAPYFWAEYAMPQVCPLGSRVEVRSLRNIREKVTIAIDRRRKDIEANAKQEVLGDFGPGDWFRVIEGHCYSKSIQGYTYRLCPFHNVTQSGVLIGSDFAWDQEGTYKAMNFSAGQRCFIGIDRSVLVSLSCCPEEEILDVSEPETCSYRMAFCTTTACQPEDYEAIRAKIDTLRQQLEQGGRLAPVGEIELKLASST